MGDEFTWILLFGLVPEQSVQDLSTAVQGAYNNSLISDKKKFYKMNIIQRPFDE